MEEQKIMGIHCNTCMKIILCLYILSYVLIVMLLKYKVIAYNVAGFVQMSTIFLLVPSTSDPEL